MQNGVMTHNYNDIISLNPITPHISIATNEANGSIIYRYDYHSGKTIQITKNSLKIYNKTATKLLINLKLMLPLDKVKMISLEKNLEYSLIYLETKTLNKSILILNLRKESVISIVRDDFRKFLGMIFLSISSQNDNNQRFFFCIIYEDRITVKMIIKETDMIIDVKEIKYPNSMCKIDEYIYNKTFKILCCIRSDKTFDFYNLDHDPYFSKAFNWNIIKRHKKHWSNEKFESMQFFLQVIYHHLYWIIFDIEKKAILLFKMEDINTMSNPFIIKVGVSIKSGTLAFSDNLIVVLDYNSWEMMVIDIISQNDNKIISTFIYSNPYNFNIDLLVWKGGSVAQYESLLYNLTFNISNYNNKCPYHLKQQAWLDLVKRKHFKQFVIESLNEMIKKKYKIKVIFDVLNLIVEEIWKGSNKKIDINYPKKSAKLIIPIEYYLKRRNRKMKQFDVYSLFVSINCNRDSYTDIDVLRFILIFNLLLNSYSIKHPPHFAVIILSLIQRIPIVTIIGFFEFNTVFDHQDVAVYLLKKSCEQGKGGLKEILRQIAFDILKRLKKYEYIVIHLLSTGFFKEAILYYSYYLINIPIKVLTGNFLKKIDEHNRKIILQYISK